MKRKKHILFAVILSFILTNCGGGGGGGGSSISIQNNPSNISKEPSNVQHIVNVHKVIPSNDTPEDSDPHNNSLNDDSLHHPSKQLFNIQVNTNKIDGHKQIVAIMDSDFLTNKEQLLNKYGTIEILDKISKNPSPNGSPHGERVLELMAENANFNIIAASIGEKFGEKIFVAPSLKLYEDIFVKFGDQKVKIINQSWGVDFNGDLKHDASTNKNYRSMLLPLQIVSENEHSIQANPEDVAKRGDELLNFYSQAVENGGLFIWANGNKDAKHNVLFQASLQPSLPVVRASLEKGWLSVIGVEEKSLINLANHNGEYYAYKHYPEHLAYPGYAQNWSISASGDGPNSSKDTLGSSYAAPRVARAAALVATKFPWMSNSQVRETLFTTTDKPELKYDGTGNLLTSDGRIDNAQERRYINLKPDPKYGWGILNTDRALKGPGAFIEQLLQTDRGQNSTNYKLYFQANIPNNEEYFFENDIYGDTGIRKSGEGRLHLTGSNTFSGLSKVSEGTLDIYKLNTGNIDIEQKGTLILHNDAIIGNSYNEIHDYDGNIRNDGTLIIKGNTITVLGSYIASKDAVTQIDFNSTLEVKGDTKLDTSKLKVTTDKYLAKPAKRELIKGNIENIDVNKIKTDGMRKVTASKANNGLIVEMSRENAIKYLNSEYASSNNAASNVEKVLQEIDTKVANKTATSDDLARGIAIVEMSHQQFEDSINKMSGEIYASAQSLTFAQSQNVNISISNHLSSLQNFKNSGYEWQGWMSGTYSDGKVSDSGYATGKTKMQIQTFGLDKKFNNSIQLGVSMSHSTAKAKFDRYAGESRSEALGISLYGKKYFKNDAYILTRIGGSKFTTKVERELINIHGNSTTGNIKHKDKMISTYIEIGKHFKYLTPYVGYGYDHLIRGEFEEKNAAWGINAARKTYHKNSLYLGVRGEYSINTYKFSSYITHSLNIGNRSLDFEGRFTNTDINQKFKGIAQIKNITLAGLGITKEIVPNFDINFNVDLKWENNKKADALFSTGVQYRF